MKIYLGADHKGFNLKEQVKDWLRAWDYDFEDLGADRLDPEDDYTLYAQKVAQEVAQEKDSRGILLCGSGVGVDVVANKVDGVRASIGKTSEQVAAGRKDDDLNVLVLAADFTSLGEARKMLKAFLKTKFDQAARHQKRLADIKRLEEKN